jgi:hypothetical protein
VHLSEICRVNIGKGYYKRCPIPIGSRIILKHCVSPLLHLPYDAELCMLRNDVVLFSMCAVCRLICASASQVACSDRGKRRGSCRYSNPVYSYTLW